MLKLFPQRTACLVSLYICRYLLTYLKQTILNVSTGVLSLAFPFILPGKHIDASVYF